MRNKLLLALVVALCLALLPSCGTDEIDISAYSDQQILLVGLTDKDKEEAVTVRQLKEMECSTKKTKSTSDKIGTVKATGPWLSTVLEAYGHKQTDFSKIKIYGKDGYDISLNKDFLQENQVMLAFGIDGEPLDEESKPVRIIIPESDSAYWIRMVNKIEFEK